MKPKAYSYVRFSSPEQAMGHSRKRQLESAQTYATDNGLEFVSDSEYAFFDSGKSAYRSKHVGDEGQLGRFLDLVKDGSIPIGSYLLVESLDRLSREKINVALPRFIDILNSGINIVTLIDKRVYNTDYSELELMISVIQMARAHDESASKGYRVSKAWRNKQELARREKKPISKAIPAWLTIENGRFIVIEERANLIKRIFDQCCNGYGQLKITKSLNNENVTVWSKTTASGKPGRRNKSGKWGISTVRKILKNRAVLGEYQPFHITKEGRKPIGDPITQYYPQIIDEDLFNEAQAALSHRKSSKQTKQSKTFNVWQKIAFCEHCNAPMHLINKGIPPKGYRYLVCSNKQKGACKNHMVRVEVAEKLFLEILSRLESLSLVQDNAAKTLKEISVLDAKIEKHQGTLKLQNEIFREHPSKSIAMIISNSESELEQLRKNRIELQQKIKQNQILDRESFINSVDLKSYEGRYRANSLLQRLGVYCQFESQREDEEYDIPIYLAISVFVKEDNRLRYGFKVYVDRMNDTPEYWPFTPKHVQIAIDQGDMSPEEGKEMIEDMNDWPEEFRNRYYTPL